MRGRPKGSQNKDKPFREALRMEIAALAEDNQRGLRRIARELILRAEAGDVTATREIADRLDGKVPQAIGSDVETGPIELSIAWANAGG